MGFIGCFISAAGLVLGAGLVGLVSAFCGPFAGERHEGERNFIALQGFLQSGIDWLGAVDGTAGLHVVLDQPLLFHTSLSALTNCETVHLEKPAGGSR